MPSIKCPWCDRKYDLVGDQKSQALVQVMRLTKTFGPHFYLMFEYALVRGGWKPTPSRELKLLRILEDLEKLWVSEKFSFNKKTYSIGKSGILWCIKTVCDKNWLSPLENDNYLKKIMVTVAEREARERSTKQEAELIQKEREQRTSGQRTEKDRGEYTSELRQLTDDLMKKLGGR